jgi:hypothetical protein
VISGFWSGAAMYSGSATPMRTAVRKSATVAAG